MRFCFPEFLRRLIPTRRKPDEAQSRFKMVHLNSVVHGTKGGPSGPSFEGTDPPYNRAYF